MRCPYCISEIDDLALACPHCARDLYLFKPLLEKITQLEKAVAAGAETRIAALEAEVAALKQATAERGPGAARRRERGGGRFRPGLCARAAQDAAAGFRAAGRGAWRPAVRLRRQAAHPARRHPPDPDAVRFPAGLAFRGAVLEIDRRGLRRRAGCGLGDAGGHRHDRQGPGPAAGRRATCARLRSMCSASASPSPPASWWESSSRRSRKRARRPTA